jgi:hypothetical protein
MRMWLVACGEVQWKCRLLSFGRDANKPRASVGTSAEDIAIMKSPVTKNETAPQIKRDSRDLDKCGGRKRVAAHSVSHMSLLLNSAVKCWVARHTSVFSGRPRVCMVPKAHGRMQCPRETCMVRPKQTHVTASSLHQTNTTCCPVYSNANQS